ncbi:TetR family transcriptional regulator [Tessaracoccus sp. MC1679]|uniref:TetR/AcrR family transcriptional regulator n=1 Tax=Tessaracoccus sp. MC1679 TaxID=2760313 RepID=UPI0015FF8B51|nr:TetR family transcriptional regulator [Tessaracoccus sp. MC1679]MBB1516955.1 TetR family transcriptional regulator [Tessaracoccus sp. MC1679]
MARMNRDQQQQHNRVLLLEAAERIFATRGVAGASLDDVALEAGLTKGAVYSNFRNKGELILEVIRYRQTLSQEAQDFHAILDRASNDYERLEAWCDIWVLTAKSGDRSSYARLLFDFIPYALRDEHLTAKFLEFISPADDIPAGASPIPTDSRFARIPPGDQFRILTALDLGLSALGLFDPENVKPELYKTAVLSLAQTLYDASDQSEYAQQT